MAGATVHISDQKMTATTDSGGRYLIPDVPFGKYKLRASKVIDGNYCSIDRPVQLDAEAQAVDLTLQPPSEAFRIASVFFDFLGVDDEVGADEKHDPGPELMQLELGPDRTVQSFHRTYRWGGELRVEYHVTLKLLVGNLIDVQIDCALYEGASESTNDLENTGSLSFQVAMNQTVARTLTVVNPGFGGGDTATLTISVKNERNNN